MSVETFTNDFITALGEGGTQAFKERYRGVDVLLIDDIQMLEGKDQTQEEFFHTFNDLHEAGKQIVISSDRPPKAMATLEARLRSRFEMGLITDVQPPDLETRIAILRKKVQAGGYQIHDPEVLPFIAARLQDNVRELEGALIRVVAQASHAKAPVTVDLAREVLRAYFPADGASISVEAIQEEVCRHYGLSIAELVGDKRDKRVVVPRQVAMYLSRELTQSSLPALGRAFGGRDHTTVMYAVNKVGKQMSDEGEIFAAVQSLTHRLKNQRLACTVRSAPQVALAPRPHRPSACGDPHRSVSPRAGSHHRDVASGSIACRSAASARTGAVLPASSPPRPHAMSRPDAGRTARHEHRSHAPSPPRHKSLSSGFITSATPCVPIHSRATGRPFDGSLHEMRLTSQRDELASKLALVARAASSKSTIPVLGQVRLDATGRSGRARGDRHGAVAASPGRRQRSRMRGAVVLPRLSARHRAHDGRRSRHARASRQRRRRRRQRRAVVVLAQLPPGGRTSPTSRSTRDRDSSSPSSRSS